MTVPARDVLAAVPPARRVAELLRPMLRDGDENADAVRVAAEELQEQILGLAPMRGEESP